MDGFRFIIHNKIILVETNFKEENKVKKERKIINLEKKNTSKESLQPCERLFQSGEKRLF